MSGRRGATLALIGCTFIVLVGCGVSNDASPRDIPARDVPFELVAVASPTDTPTEGGDAGQIFLVGPERLAAAGRTLGPNGNAFDAITTLLAGPTAEEAAQGLRTAIPSGTRLLAADLEDGVLTIDLSNELLLVQGVEQRTAVAQLVFTSTGTDDVDRVLFAIEGNLTEVPVDDGSLSAEPLTRFAYPSLDPTRLPPPNPGGALPTTTTTTTTTVPPPPETTAAAPAATGG